MRWGDYFKLAHFLKSQKNHKKITTMKTLQELKAERNALLDRYRAAFDDAEIDTLHEQIAENERQQAELKRSELLSRVNREQAAKRELARQVWECETPPADIATDAGFHKAKVKKYPKLAALIENSWTGAKWKDDVLVELRGLQLVESKYEYGKPTIHTRPESFEEFLQLNNIAPAEITETEFAEFSEKLNEATDKLQKAIDEYSATRVSLNCSFMQHIGLVDQHASNTYLYNSRKS